MTGDSRHSFYYIFLKKSFTKIHILYAFGEVVIVKG